MAGRNWSTNRALATLSSLRTGIVLLILLGIASIAGTLILQRPLTDPADMQRAYSANALKWLDTVGLTDVFHARWFIALMALLCVNIVLASLERFPTAWRYFSRPYLRPTPHFLSGLPLQQEVEVPASTEGLRAAERALAKMGLKPQRVGGDDGSLYSERHRLGRMAPYIVHASLLLILGGGLVDAIWGYRGFVAMTKGQTVQEIELRNGESKMLPFALRCDSAGQENHPDGTPKRWWSQLAVLKDGREVVRKEIEVNDPLVYGGLRFFQSSYGSTGEVGAVRLRVTKKDGSAAPRDLALSVGHSAELDEGAVLHLAEFVPDFVVVNGRVETRSEQPNNPAIKFLLESKDGAVAKTWVFPRFPGFSHNEELPYSFEFQGMDTGYYTGLQVAFEPGQWGVWAGCILMAIGLMMAFYMTHIRFWVVPLSDARGRAVLWVGASASKNREEFEERFQKLVKAIQEEVETGSAVRAQRSVAVPAQV